MPWPLATVTKILKRMNSLLCLNLARLNRLGPRPQFPSKPKTVKFSTLVRASFENSEAPTNQQQQQQQLNLSVLRFTLGIPGLDESYLPRWIGYGFGSLLLLNRLVGSDSASTTSAQIITEILGLSLASFSVSIPYLGKFLKGAQRMDQATLPEESDQIFIMSQNIPDTLKEDMAWASYVLLRNTNAIAVLISIRGQICVRGYWNMPRNLSKENLLIWFEEKMKFIGLSDLKDTLYFPKDGGAWDFVPNGTQALLVQPLQEVTQQDASGLETTGFVLLASTLSYAFSVKDRAWISAITNKFGVTKF